MIFVVFSEKDETMYRKGITVQFSPPDSDEVESEAVSKEEVEEKEGNEK